MDYYVSKGVNCFRIPFRFKRIANAADLAAIDTETTSLDEMRADIVGISFGKLATLSDGLGEFSLQLGRRLAARAGV